MPWSRPVLSQWEAPDEMHGRHFRPCRSAAAGSLLRLHSPAELLRCPVRSLAVGHPMPALPLTGQVTPPLSLSFLSWEGIKNSPPFRVVLTSKRANVYKRGQEMAKS